MARLIKRYDNRKLYDTEASAYVSLSDIAHLVRRGETVQVIDNATGQDLTAQTLTQIILEEGKAGQHAIPSEALHELLRRSGQALDSGLDQLRVRVDDLVQHSVERLRSVLGGPQAKEVDDLRKQLRALEQQLARVLEHLPAEPDTTPAADQAPPAREATPPPEEA
ncbi:polyhydroxyalkanoate synthesis regulator DNA-binding domain-containing protein [Salisaeta longa]|uniref:polyhydroxyalkanoate synthesis regulator DNA-binding domain-containing protein n=1 Tax=Salisaeta longa TaxID=503170 RepID=UPI0003B70C6D|nr:polyhydroxyalkanoate synthesis regulator DNA-binding domain-containing protein [Salisaeta longa]